MILPVITPSGEVIGTISVDTLSAIEGEEEEVDAARTFQTHEVSFLQGVGMCLGEVYDWLNSRVQLMDVARSALSWLHRRCPEVSQAEVYVVEPAIIQEVCMCVCICV